MGLNPLCDCDDLQNCLCEHKIYFFLRIRDTHFWCAVTLVCVRVDAFGVDLG